MQTKWKIFLIFSYWACIIFQLACKQWLYNISLIDNITLLSLLWNIQNNAYRLSQFYSQSSSLLFLHLRCGIYVPQYHTIFMRVYFFNVDMSQHCYVYYTSKINEFPSPMNNMSHYGDKLSHLSSIIDQFNLINS